MKLGLVRRHFSAVGGAELYTQRLAEGLTARGHQLTTAGTDNHLMLLDLRGTGVTGTVGEEALGKADITVNKNMVPFDPEKPMTTSGIRVGTPAVTTRGMKEPEMDAVAGLIARVLKAPADDASLAAVRTEVHALAARFPLYPRMLKELDGVPSGARRSP